MPDPTARSGDMNSEQFRVARNAAIDAGRGNSPCLSCIGKAEAAVENAGQPLSPVQEGGFWDGFRHAQKALRDLRLAAEENR